VALVEVQHKLVAPCGSNSACPQKTRCPHDQLLRRKQCASAMSGIRLRKRGIRWARAFAPAARNWRNVGEHWRRAPRRFRLCQVDRCCFSLAAGYLLNASIGMITQIIPRKRRSFVSRAHATLLPARGAVLTDACTYAIAPTAHGRMRRTQPGNCE